jgi:hypothetical protein
MLRAAMFPDDCLRRPGIEAEPVSGGIPFFNEAYS